LFYKKKNENKSKIKSEMEKKGRIEAQWGPVWQRTLGATAVGLVAGAVLARRRLRLGFSGETAGGVDSLLASAAAKSSSTAIASASLAGGLFAGTTTGVFLGSLSLSHPHTTPLYFYFYFYLFYPISKINSKNNI
jgi:hypothetical protein